MCSKKKARSWKTKEHPFLVSLGDEARFFKDYETALIHGNCYDISEFILPEIKKILNKNYYQWRSAHKGSIRQYAEYFPDYRLLQELKKLL